MMTVTKYKAFDGEEFDERAECRAHERKHAHLRLIGLTAAQVENAVIGLDPELADAIEIVGARIARARLAAGELKRQPNNAVKPRQITHQPERVEELSAEQHDDLDAYIDSVEETVQQPAAVLRFPEGVR